MKTRRNVTLRVQSNAEDWGQVLPEYPGFTMDWWGPRNDAWGNSSVINVDFGRLEVYARALGPSFWRIGGSQADTIIYWVDPELNSNGVKFGPCLPNHCLRLERWQQIMDFAAKVGSRIIFCLNYLSHTTVDGTYDRRDWDSGNAWGFLNYTSHHAPAGVIYGFELGNELTHNQKATNLTRMKLAYRTLGGILKELWPTNTPKVMGPASTGGDTTIDIVKVIASELDIITYHKYFGKGTSPMLEKSSFEPSFYYHPAHLEQRPQSIREYSNASIWIAESAMASNSGRKNVTDSFVSVLWTANFMASLVRTSHDMYCRQALIGGYYDLVDHDSYTPNPDFWLFWLWKTLVGQLAVGPIRPAERDQHPLITWGCCSEPTKDTLLVHSFCAKPSDWAQPGDLILVVINISPKEEYSISLPMGHGRSDFTLTAALVDSFYLPLGVRHVLLNGELLKMNKDGSLPSLRPTQVNSRKRSLIAPPYSLSFVIVHKANLTVCMNLERGVAALDEAASHMTTKYTETGSKRNRTVIHNDFKSVTLSSSDRAFGLSSENRTVLSLSWLCFLFVTIIVCGWLRKWPKSIRRFAR